MPAPRHIFIDTSVWDAQSYNFSSSALTALTQLSRSARLKLILTQPSEREILRHTSERATEAVKALEEARRKAPFLTKWPKWPLRKDDPQLRYQLMALAQSEYARFKTHFDIVSLDNSKVDIDEILQWYETGRAPFGPGKKRKEFPDAIMLSALISYAKEARVHIGVLSQDGDMRRACSLHHELLFFGSIAALTEAVLSEDKRLELLKRLLEQHEEPIIAAIAEQFPQLAFFPVQDPSGDAGDVLVKSVKARTMNALGLGEHEATVAFTAEVAFSAFLSINEDTTYYRDDGTDFPAEAENRLEGKVHDSTTVDGVIKLSMSPDWGTITGISQVAIETGDIGVEGYPRGEFELDEPEGEHYSAEDYSPPERHPDDY